MKFAAGKDNLVTEEAYQLWLFFKRIGIAAVRVCVGRWLYRK